MESWCPSESSRSLPNKQQTKTPDVAKGMNQIPGKIDIAVAGDLLGHLIGTLSHTEGTVAVGRCCGRGHESHSLGRVEADS